MDVVTIATFSGLAEAYLFKGALEEAGIQCYLADEQIINANPLLTAAIGGIKLRVRTEDQVNAKQILQEIRGGDFALEETDIETCPRCNSQNVKRVDYTNWEALLSSFFFLVPMGNVKRRWKCGECGNVWKA